MKKLLSLALALLVVLPLLTACTPDAEPKETETPPASAIPTETTEPSVAPVGDAKDGGTLIIRESGVPSISIPHFRLTTMAMLRLRTCSTG